MAGPLPEHAALTSASWATYPHPAEVRTHPNPSTEGSGHTLATFCLVSSEIPYITTPSISYPHHRCSKGSPRAQQRTFMSSYLPLPFRALLDGSWHPAGHPHSYLLTYIWLTQHSMLASGPHTYLQTGPFYSLTCHPSLHKGSVHAGNIICPSTH